MNKEFIPYELVLSLKDLGIDFVPIGYHRYDMKRKPVISNETAVRIHGSTDCLNHPAILYQQAFRWFRNKHKLDKTIDNWTEQPMDNEVWPKAYQYFINGEAFHPYFKTYEEAELACLNKLIEIVKSK
jgi:hypothetical protein